MKILVPVDGSPASKIAVKEAIRIAKEDNASITLMTVIGNHFMSENEAHYAQQFQLMKDNGTKLLDSYTDTMDFGQVPVEKEIDSGVVYDKIIDKANSEKFDMVVMANRGFSKIRRFFVGSVTQRVLAEVKCPVLVVHAEAEA